MICPCFSAEVSEASELMGHHNVRHLPVTKDHQVVGVITDRDMTSAMHVRSQSDDAGPLLAPFYIRSCRQALISSSVSTTGLVFMLLPRECATTWSRLSAARP